ncbi:MAG: DUF3570 domain-containing protein [Gammaproteobacteria bacterium]|nr:DUF3570 domain-containing protein [Gammaproteobacteria bacterium]MBL6998510.1 DUF3570 domain-containing protein [Gammaproteobacteria bacterium]
MHAKALGVPGLLQAVAVVVTRTYRAVIAWLLLCSLPLQATVLPEDRADLLYHSFNGGGAEISGPSLLVRKKFSEKATATFNHYVDNVSSASIDVITTASPYTEQREENSLSIDYLNEKTLLSLGYGQSSENDFDASTVSVSIAQDMFGDLTTLSMGYAQGDNTVRRNGDASFAQDVVTRNYRLSLSQVINKDFLMAFAVETMTDQGFLNNPYRQVRYIDPTNLTRGYSYQEELYPNTRTSHALALRGRYYLPQRAALSGGYRYFTDTWGIEAQTWELGYTLPYQEDWLFEFSYRYYDQTRADFYADLFQSADELIFLARDKELSSFSSQTFGLGASYEFKKNGSGLLKRGSLNLHYDFIRFDYADFRDLTVTSAVGEEPLYSFDAAVIRLFVSIWF